MQELTNTLDSINGSRFNALLEKTAPEHRWLIAYAAFPVALTSDLLFKIWVNFRAHVKPGEPVSTPVSLVPQILLSPVCKEISRDVYEIFPGIRAALLAYIRQHPEWGMPKIEDLARFLSAYVSQCRSRIPSTAFAEALRWTADAYLKPERAAESLLKAISDGAINGWPCARIHYFISWAQQLGFNASDEVVAEEGRSANPLLTALRLAEGVELFNADRTSESIERFKSLRHLLEPPKEVSEKCFQTHIPKMVWDVLELESKRVVDVEVVEGEMVEKELDSYAIVVGVRESHQRKKQEISAESNANAFYKWLNSDAGGGLHKEHIKLYTDPQPADHFVELLDSAFNSFHLKENRRNRIYLYFAGQGGITDAYDLVLTLNYGKSDRRDFFITSYAKKFEEKGFGEILIFFDCLEMLYDSQPFTRFTRNFLSHWQGKNYLLAASVPYTNLPHISGMAQASGLNNECSLFTSTLIIALNGEAADENGDITAGSVLQYVSSRIQSSKFLISEQDFTILSDISNDFLCDVEMIFSPDAVGHRAEVSTAGFQTEFIVTESLSWKLKLRCGQYHTLKIPGLHLVKPFAIDPLLKTHTIDLDWQKDFRRVLVLTSDKYMIGKPEDIINGEIGGMLAENNYGLINGGRQLADVYFRYYKIRYPGREPRVVQFGGRAFDFFYDYATIIATSNDNEWYKLVTENVLAIIMIGGNSTSLEIYQHAIALGIPVIPIPCTGGNAATAYMDMLRTTSSPYLQYLENMPLQISSQQDAKDVAKKVLQMLELTESRRQDGWKLFAFHTSQDHELCIKIIAQLSFLNLTGHTSHIEAVNVDKADFHKIPDGKAVILLLLSADYLASSKFALQLEWLRAKQLSGAIIIPVTLTVCAWDRIVFLSSLTSLPSNRMPVTAWPNTDEAITDIVNGVRRQINLKDTGLNEVLPNRILIAEKLTAEQPEKTEFVHGLRSLEDVFRHYKPKLKVEFQIKGEVIEELFNFNSIQGFSLASIVSRSQVLKNLQKNNDHFNAIHKVLTGNSELSEDLSYNYHRRHVINVLGRLLELMTWKAEINAARPVILFFGHAQMLIDIEKQFLNADDVEFIAVDPENAELSMRYIAYSPERFIIAHFTKSVMFGDDTVGMIKISVLSELPNLKLVLFNAPLSNDKVDILLKNGIKAVIAPVVDVPRFMVTDFYSSFYKELARTNSISKAFKIANGNGGSKFKALKIIKAPPSPWTAYYSAETDDQLIQVQTPDLQRIINSWIPISNKKLVNSLVLAAYNKRSPNDPQETDEEVRSLIYKWCDLMEHDVNEMLSICEDEIRYCQKTHERYLSHIFEKIRKLERAYRNVALFFENIDPGNNENISFVNYHANGTSAKSESQRAAIADEFAANYDRLELRAAYSLFVLPLAENDLSSLQSWARIAHENKLLLITDYPSADNPEQIIKNLKVIRNRDNAIFSNVLMTCNKLIDRPKNLELSEREDMLLSASFALAGTIYMELIHDPIRQIQDMQLKGINEVQFAFSQTKSAQLFQMGLIPIEKINESITCGALRTFYLGNHFPLQTYQVVRLLDYISKVIVDLLNRMAFETYNAVVMRENMAQIAKFLDKCSAPGWLSKYKIARFDMVVKGIVLEIALRIGSMNVQIQITGERKDYISWNSHYLSASDRDLE